MDEQAKANVLHNPEHRLHGQFTLEKDTYYHKHDHKFKEAFIIYEEDWIRSEFQSYELQIDKVLSGVWRLLSRKDISSNTHFQDVFIAKKS